MTTATRNKTPVAGTGAGRAYPRRRVRTGIMIAVAAGLMAGFGVFGKEAIERQLIADSAAANRALVDQASTTALVGDVSTTIERIFTYDADSIAETGRRAETVLTGQARRQYRQLFDQVREHASGKKVKVSTRVVRAGAITLEGQRNGDTAMVLIFLDQVIDRGGKAGGDPDPAAAQLVVEAVRVGGEWKISGIESTNAKGER